MKEEDEKWTELWRVTGPLNESIRKKSNEAGGILILQGFLFVLLSRFFVDNHSEYWFLQATGLAMVCWFISKLISRRFSGPGNTAGNPGDKVVLPRHWEIKFIMVQGLFVLVLPATVSQFPTFFTDNHSDGWHMQFSVCILLGGFLGIYFSNTKERKEVEEIKKKGFAEINKLRIRDQPKKL
jgi:hypothetical protein